MKPLFFLSFANKVCEEQNILKFFHFISFKKNSGKTDDLNLDTLSNCVIKGAIAYTDLINTLLNVRLTGSND